MMILAGAGAVIVAFGISFISARLLRRLAGRVGMMDVPGDHKAHGRAVPLLGGSAIFAGIALPSALGLSGKVRRADADLVREATGFSIGGVAPVGHPMPLRTVIDASLGRFERVFAAARHSHCVFGCAPEDLQKMTGAATDSTISE